MEDEKPQEETSAQPGEIAEEDRTTSLGLFNFADRAAAVRELLKRGLAAEGLERFESAAVDGSPQSTV
jgi:hypothetical protein